MTGFCTGRPLPDRAVTSARVVTAHQPHYLPWLGYLHRISLADVFVVMDTMEYTHHSYINRNRIVGPSGMQWLTVPVRYRSFSRRPIRDIETCNQRRWKEKHLRTLAHCYRRGDGFAELFPRLAAAYAPGHSSILDLDMAILRAILAHLDVKTEIVLASESGIEGRKEDELFLSLLRRTRCDEVSAIRHPKRSDGVPPARLVLFIPYSSVSIGQRLWVEHDCLSN